MKTQTTPARDIDKYNIYEAMIDKLFVNLKTEIISTHTDQELQAFVKDHWLCSIVGKLSLYEHPYLLDYISDFNCTAIREGI